jgi:hypothetical protein
MYKPGYKTSEFWVTLISFVCSGLYLIGIISFEDSNSTTGVLAHAVESIILIAGQAAIFMGYIKSRSVVKQKTLEEESKEREKQNDNRRKSSTRTKSNTKSTRTKSKGS